MTERAPIRTGKRRKQTGFQNDDVIASVDRKAMAASEWVLPAHQARSREQLERLLAAAERVFALRGFAETHVSDIVEEAGCSVGSFYRRFKDKEALFLALQLNMYNQSSRNIDRFYANPFCEDSSVVAILFRFIENTAHGMRRIRGYYRALFEISLRGRDVWGQMRDLEQHMALAIRNLLVRRGYKNLTPDFVAVVAFVLRVINGSLISLMLHGPGPYEMEDPVVTAQFTRMLMRAANLDVDERALKKLVAARSASGPRPAH
jgi:AcrR family transcriptional regulator